MAEVYDFTTPFMYGRYLRHIYSPHMAVGNTPHISTDSDGGWSWITAGIGAAVGTGIRYAATGDWRGAVIGGLGGAAIGGLSFNQTRVGFDGGTIMAHSNVRIRPSSFGNFLASKSPSILDDVAGFYLRVESIDPDKIWLMGKDGRGGGNQGTFDQDDIRPDEALTLYPDLGGYRSNIINLETDCWFCVPEFDIDSGDNSVDAELSILISR